MLRSLAARNLSLNILRTQQIAILLEALCIDKRGKSNKVDVNILANFANVFDVENGDIKNTAWQSLLLMAFPNESVDAAVNANKSLKRLNEENYGTLHHRATDKRVIKPLDVFELRWYLTKVEGLANEDLPVDKQPFTASIWKRCMLNRPELDQVQATSYIRCSRYELPDARDATHVRYIRRRNIGRSNLPNDRSQFGQVEYYLAYDSGDPKEPIMLAMIREIQTEAMAISIAGVSGVPHNMHRMVSGASTARYFVDIDDILALQAIVSVGKWKFFAERNSCLYK